MKNPVTKTNPLFIFKFRAYKFLGLSIAKYIVILQLLGYPFFASSQWTWQTPLPTGANYRACDFIDTSNGWIAGDWGCIIHTSDGGLSWELQPTGVTADLYAIYFLNENYGWAVGNRGTILHTKNGGTTWLIQQYGSVSSAYITSVYFADSLKGWADGTNGGGQYYKTTNGGEDWQMDHIPGVSYAWELSAMCFTDSLFFWALSGYNQISHTEDGGNTWISNYSPTSWGKIFFVNQDTGWLTADSKIYRTNDRGMSWFEQDHPHQGPAILGVHFTDPLHGWASGSDLMLRTSDGGEIWENTETDVLFWDVEFTDTGNGWAVGGWFGELFHSTDGGISWAQQRQGTDGFMTHISFGNEDFGMAITYTLSGEHAVVHTDDGGATWTRKFIDPDSTRWNGLHVFDYRNGWICGWDGSVMHTANSGYTWEMQRNNHPGEWLSEIRFINLNDGFAAGVDLSGTKLIFLKTTDGGHSWTSYEKPFNGYINGLWFTDKDNGYIIARDADLHKAVILITRTGGQFWEELVLPVPEGFYATSVQFVNEDLGFISGENYILKTTNRGESWEKTSFTGHNFNSLWFTDSLNGWCAGRNAYNGVAYRTIDGGNSWNNIPLITDNDILDVYFTSNENGWVCGDGGTILKWGENNPVFINEDTDHDYGFRQIIYPNPANSTVNISLTWVTDNQVNIKVLSATGQMVKSGIYSNNGTDKKTYEIKVDDLADGIYFIQTTAGEESAADKFLIMH